MFESAPNGYFIRDLIVFDGLRRDLTEDERERLERRCFIPLGRDHVVEGLYSWNESRPNEHNCCSWVISVVNHTKNDAAFIVCDRPKRLKWVKVALWGQ